MLYSIADFASQCFSIIVIVTATIIATQICFGYGTRKAKESFVGLILFTLCAIQSYQLVFAVIYVPADRFFVYNVCVLFKDLFFLIIILSH